MWRRSWSEEERLKWLQSELTGKRPLLPPGMATTAEVAEVLSTFRILAELPPDSLGAYIISMAHTGSDVLAVVLLQVHLRASSPCLLPVVCIVEFPQEFRCMAQDTEIMGDLKRVIAQQALSTRLNACSIYSSSLLPDLVPPPITRTTGPACFTVIGGGTSQPGRPAVTSISMLDDFALKNC